MKVLPELAGTNEVCNAKAWHSLNSPFESIVKLPASALRTPFGEMSPAMELKTGLLLICK